MSFDDFYKRITAFGLAFALGLFAAAFSYAINFSNIFNQKSTPATKVISAVTNFVFTLTKGNGNGASGGCLGPDDPQYLRRRALEKLDSKPTGPTESVKILSKPRANYTDAARTNAVQGKVVLRVTFSANGTIGAISVINGLPDGLTETAKEAAKGIKFKPAKRGGVPYSVTKPVEYTFTIY